MEGRKVLGHQDRDMLESFNVCQQGYVIIMINPNGSTGVTSDFQKAVRNDW